MNKIESNFYCENYSYSYFPFYYPHGITDCCVGDSATACADKQPGGLGAILSVLNNPTIITPNLSDDSYSAAVVILIF